eukprot:TRINITY_DN22170_c0_g1_i1.p1 TRINITY_DN22170_c0_g1~~TRINITY_DN22170_c0_g1_i1.p1  ORF type:complete len:605 (-),score=54.49 TRINITY_DN22170_c0_g1_i1:130-1944(-)
MAFGRFGGNKKGKSKKIREALGGGGQSWRERQRTHIKQKRQAGRRDGSPKTGKGAKEDAPRKPSKASKPGSRAPTKRQFMDDYLRGKADEEAKKEPAHTSWRDRNALSAAGAGARKAGDPTGGDKSISPFEWARVLALQGLGVQVFEGPVITRITATGPWRGLAGSSLPSRPATLHPLSQDDFFNNFFTQRAVVLRRGPRHPVPMPLSTAAGLLRNYRLGTHAEIIRPGNERKTARPEAGTQAVSALARGKPVKLSSVESRKRKLLYRDGFLRTLSRLMSGRKMAAVSLVWAPPKVSPWAHPQERLTEQVVVQLHGTRRWTVCRRGTPLPPRMNNTANQSAVSSSGAVHLLPEAAASCSLETGTCARTTERPVRNCSSVLLRQGDVLSIPSQSWFWTDKGSRSSAHLNYAVSAPIAADLMLLGGGRDTLGFVGPQASLGRPVPLWKYSRVEDALNESIELCQGLPWPAKSERARQTACTADKVRSSLLRIWRDDTPINLDPGENFALHPEDWRSFSPRAGGGGVFMSPQTRQWMLHLGHLMCVIGGLAFMAWMFYVFCRNLDDENGMRQKRRKAQKLKESAKKHGMSMEDLKTVTNGLDGLKLD